MPLSDTMTLEEFLAFEPEEVGLQLLPILAAWPSRDQLDTTTILTLTTAGFPTTAETAIAAHEALAWLEASALILPPPNYGGATTRARMLSRRAKRLAMEARPTAAYRAWSLPRDSLHPALRDDVWQLYHRRRYDTAVFEAMKAVEVSVRAAGNFSNDDYGMPMMRRAFNVHEGVLTDKGATPGERDALSALFAGAIGYFKNPVSHRVVGMQEEAAEVIMLANLLLRIVASRDESADPAGDGEAHGE
ncbi:TIGR02391 family protein [Tardiphaga sp. 71_E8_N1_1]|uniref:TIGR02391 family protein n=1 Tax=Tardiphaga sp. 71_E8_N1_1 TaxID=3240784 RepID=UPI003F8B5B24